MKNARKGLRVFWTSVNWKKDPARKMTQQREIYKDIIKISKDQTYSGAILENSRGDQEQHCSHEQILDIGCVRGLAL